MAEKRYPNRFRCLDGPLAGSMALIRCPTQFQGELKAESMVGNRYQCLVEFLAVTPVAHRCQHPDWVVSMAPLVWRHLRWGD